MSGRSSAWSRPWCFSALVFTSTTRNSETSEGTGGTLSNLLPQHVREHVEGLQLVAEEVPPHRAGEGADLEEDGRRGGELGDGQSQNRLQRVGHFIADDLRVAAGARLAD